MGVARPDIEPRATQYVPQHRDMIEHADRSAAMPMSAANGDVLYSVAKLPGLRQAFRQAARRSARRRARRSRRGQARSAGFRAVEACQAGRARPGNRPGAPGRPGLAHRVLGHVHGAAGRRISTSTAAAWTSSFRTTRTRSRSRCGATGEPFANYWMHNGFVNVDNEKMSKSLGNFFTRARCAAAPAASGGAALFHAVQPLPRAHQLLAGKPAAGR